MLPTLDRLQLRNRMCAAEPGAFAGLDFDAAIASVGTQEPMVRRLVWGFSCQAIVFGFSSQFFVRSGKGKAVLRPVACDQVPGARGRGQGTETLAELGGVPP